MGLTNPTRELNPRHKLSTTWHVGIVIDNNDPDKLQRIKLRVRDAHRNVPDDHLPWAIPIGGHLAGQTTGIGTVDVPVLGSAVFCTYLDDSGYAVGYAGGVINKLDLNQEMVATDYPHVRARIDRSGNLFLDNTETDTITLVHVSGTTIQIDGKGHMQIHIADHAVGPNAKSEDAKGLDVTIIGDCSLLASGKLDLQAVGDVTLRSSGNMAITAGGDLSIQCAGSLDMRGNRIDFNKGSPSVPAVSSPSAPTARQRPTTEAPQNDTEY